MCEKLTDFKSPEKEILLHVFEDIPYIDKWIASLVENYIYAWVIEDASFMLKQDKGILKYVMRYDKKHGPYEQWYTQCDGKIQNILYIQTTYKDNKMHGEYKEWYTNGKLCIETTYKDGKLHGEYKQWYANGKLKKQTTYKEGEFHGEYKHWWNTDNLNVLHGQLYYNEVYTNGLRDGKSTSYWPNGNRRLTCYFKNGKRASKLTEWNESGDIITR